MTPAEFYNKTIGNLYEMDGAPVGDPYQCADYFKKACVDLLGYSWPAGGDGYVQFPGERHCRHAGAGGPGGRCCGETLAGFE